MGLMRTYQEKVKGGYTPAATAESKTARASGKVGLQQLAALVSKALDEALKKLSALNSTERKEELKRDVLIPQFSEYVDRFRAESVKHDLLGYYMVWLFDAGLIERGLDMGLYCLANGIDLPERFKRDTGVFLADQVLDWAEAENEAGRTVEPYFSTLFDLLQGKDSTPLDVPDQVQARAYRMRGMECERLENWAQAVEAYEVARKLGAKVKTKLKSARKRLNDN